MNKWYAVHIRPRWEKKVYNSLIEKGIECFCPVKRIARKWSDRIKTIEEPLFKSYVFVKINDNDRKNVRMTAGVLNFANQKGKPVIIKEKHILEIQELIIRKANIDVIRQELPDFSNATHINGHNKELKIIHLESLGYLLHATLDKKDLITAPTIN